MFNVPKWQFTTPIPYALPDSFERNQKKKTKYNTTARCVLFSDSLSALAAGYRASQAQQSHRGDCVGCSCSLLCSPFPSSPLALVFVFPALLRARFHAGGLPAGALCNSRFASYAAIGPLVLSTKPAWPTAACERPSVPGCALAESPPEGRTGMRGGGCGLALAPAAAASWRRRAGERARAGGRVG